MDNLRATIYVLFNHRNGWEIVDSVNNLLSDRGADSFIDQDWFCRCFREKYNIYSHDQIIEIYNILSTNWMKAYNTPTNPTSLSFAADSVFNVLLHYNTEILLEKEQFPVCRYHQLFRWHLLVSQLGEDLFTTSFLAAKDVAMNNSRNVFSWNHCINHDNAALNHILRQSVADIHFHLKGSSFNFDLNWLSLMNSIDKRRKEFKKLEKLQNPAVIFLDNNRQSDDFYTGIAKACLIRYLLFGKITGSLSIEEEKYIDFLLISGAGWLVIAPWLEPKLKSARYNFGKSYGPHKVDYAIPANLTYDEYTDQNRYRNSILSGERWLMYHVFCRIYSGDKGFDKYATLFYAYLTEKTRLRQELVLLNKKNGFANFATYEGRKEQFIPKGSVYEMLIPHQAIHNTLKENQNNYVEARITPKDNAHELNQSIRITDRNIFHPSFRSPAFSSYATDITNYHYTLHFIKEKETPSRNNIPDPRSKKLRERVAKQALAIAQSRDYINGISSRIVGIDAANTEIGCRPEIFAQAFRYLRGHSPKKWLEYIFPTNQHQLGFTYHAGEDYMDLVDGLRAIDETVKFLNFSDGDRLGHALALGVDTEEYYIRKNRTIVMSLHDFLDNTVWLWAKIRNYSLTESFPLLYKLQQWYESSFIEIYGRDRGLLVSNLPSMHTYYQSWLLRGDNPSFYSINGRSNNAFMIGYNKYGFNKYSEEIIEARTNQDACKLYYSYHFDEDAKVKGAKSQQWKIDALYQLTIRDIQNRMCFEIEKKHICIETNPTSNYLIGSLGAYSNHPITKFFNLGINTSYLPSQIPVSINTDDLGVFHTNIEREFSLIALAMEKHTTNINTPGDIYEWINRVRESSFRQRFINT